MTDYRRARFAASTYFFTVVLADRSSTLLVSEIARLRRVYGMVQDGHPFETIAICILPDHIHAIWSLPDGDASFSRYGYLINRRSSCGIDACPRSPSKRVNR